jgi:hypothetical protein
VILIKMRAVGECGPACLATIVGAELDDVVAWAHARERSYSYGTAALNDDDMLEYLHEHGYPDARQATSALEPPAILTVPSLNVPGLLHFVVWDEERQIVDPSLGPKLWPDDAPVVNGERVGIQWATAIVLGEKQAV